MKRGLRVGSTFTPIEADECDSAIAPRGQREAITSFEEIQAKLNEQAVQNGKAGELSAHPLTQAVITEMTND